MRKHRLQFMLCIFQNFEACNTFLRGLTSPILVLTRNNCIQYLSHYQGREWFDKYGFKLIILFTNRVWNPDFELKIESYATNCNENGFKSKIQGRGWERIQIIKFSSKKEVRWNIWTFKVYRFKSSSFPAISIRNLIQIIRFCRSQIWHVTSKIRPFVISLYDNNYYY